MQQEAGCLCYYIINDMTHQFISVILRSNIYMATAL